MSSRTGSPGLAAIDIGGANVKAAHDCGQALTIPFEVWHQPEKLGLAIQAVLERLPQFSLLAMTTTAELCDCFATKRDGVVAVLKATSTAVETVAPSAQIRVWQNDGQFVSLQQALANPLPVGAANWLALAQFAGTLVGPGAALAADMGSTTVDLVAVVDGVARPSALTDTDRLIASELVYTGLRRTPVSAILQAVPYRGRNCPTIPELFATTADVHVILGNLRENPNDTRTADGTELTRRRARARLARMVGADIETFSWADAQSLAARVAKAQGSQIQSAAVSVAARLETAPKAIVIAGEGEHLLHKLLQELWPNCEMLALAKHVGEKNSVAACAYALLTLLRAWSF